jgi:xylulokinase
MRDLFGSAGYAELIGLAERSPAGSNGLLMLPYFAGERTPIADPDARGVIAGLTLSHTRGDLYRAALEATAFGVRHNIEVMEAAGGRIDRIVAVGGGAQGTLWTQIVSDVTGRRQSIPSLVVGASLGAAFLAAAAVGPADIAQWNPIVETRVPDPRTGALYDGLYALYRGMYVRTADTAHALAAVQRRASTPAFA